MTARLPSTALPWRVPPLPAPPHDPSSLLLAGTVGSQPVRGWRAARLERVEIAAGAGELVLAPTPDATRRLVEASGSFGGLRLPLNAALGPAGDVYMLDAQAAQLKRFDPCTCRFEAVPCFLRLAAPPQPCATGSGPRRVPLDLLSEPHGIALCGGDVYLADSGHARVLRYSMNGFLARGALQLPRAEAMKRAPWYPFALAFDGEGRLYVCDPHNACIDVFDAQGRWRGAHPTATSGGPMPAWALALDCRDRLYAVLSDQAPGLGSQNDGLGACWSWPAGASTGVVLLESVFRPAGDRADQTRDFRPPPMPIDARGHLHLACAGGDAVFDARGFRLPAEAMTLEERYERNGIYRSAALDSQIEGCQWHRIELRGALPEGCTVRVQTLSAQIELDEAEVAGLPEQAWGEGSKAAALDRNGRWDCLVRSPPGRFLWLRLELSGDGYATPGLEALVAEFPRISLRRYLPAVFGAEPASADFTDRFTAIFDTTLRSIEQRLDRLASLFDPLSAPAEPLVAPAKRKPGDAPDFLTWIASWIGLALTRDWPEERRRRYVKEAARLYCLRGTPLGLWRQLLLFLGLDEPRCLSQRGLSKCVSIRNCAPQPVRTPAAPPPLILEHFKLRRWLHAGRGRLGEDSMLWGRRIVGRAQLSDTEPGKAIVGESRLDAVADPLRDPFHVYAHRFSVFVPARVRGQDGERRALEQLLARESPAHTLYDVRYVEPRFRVGVQATLGLDSVIARTPGGVSLEESVLGQGSVLSAPPARRGGPKLRVGEARVGSSTVLT